MRKFFLLIFFCVAALSCEKEITYNIPDGDPKIVMYAFLEKDSTLDVQIYKTVSIISDVSCQMANPGWISLYKDSVLLAKKYYAGDTVLATFQEVIIDDSVNYELKFESDSLNVLSASTNIPIAVPILGVDTVQTHDIAQTLSDSTVHCKVIFKDPYGIKNYYQLSVYSLVVEGTETKSAEINFSKDDKLFLSSTQVDGVWKGVDFEGLFIDTGVDGFTNSLNITIPKRFFLDTKGQDKKIEFRLYSLSYEYYEYYKSRKIADGYKGIPFLDPVKIYSNVKNGEGCVSGLSLNTYLLNAVP